MYPREMMVPVCVKAIIHTQSVCMLYACACVTLCEKSKKVCMRACMCVRVSMSITKHVYMYNYVWYTYRQLMSLTEPRGLKVFNYIIVLRYIIVFKQWMMLKLLPLLHPYLLSC